MAVLLHTVCLTIRSQTLAAEPCLVVGLIAGIRKVLVVTAEAESPSGGMSKGSICPSWRG
ncbi:hypothetical protein ACIBL8_38430 [Streptomyces sp. NPDC050523]|uniref:hypothetical protein n=1 Tax=Streptomyces sp. NPDC050523 TaxID=3365622 RepID=UPI0037BCF7F8